MSKSKGTKAVLLAAMISTILVLFIKNGKKGGREIYL
jgi:hypothetical protein